MAWPSVLPIESQRRFFHEMSAALVVAASGTTLRPVQVLLGDWRATAEMWADPNTRERLRLRPLDRSDNPNRTHRLKPPLDSKKVNGRKLPQWQHEITGAGCVHYCPGFRQKRLVHI